jgi:hypothetical protein
MRPITRSLGAAVSVAVTVLASPASAQLTDRQRAEAYFERARGRVQAGRCDLAIEDFKGSIDYEPSSVGARLNLGDCYVTLGRLPEAFQQFKTAEANAVAHGDPRIDAARRAAAETEAKLVRVLLREQEPVIADLAVTVDGAPAGERPWVITVMPDTPHVLAATAPNGATWRADVSGTAGQTVRLDVVLRSPAQAKLAQLHGTSPLATLGAVAGAVGVAAVVTGVVFGVVASSSRSALADAVNRDPQCAGAYPNARCAPAAEARLGTFQDRAFTQSTISTVSFVAGGVLVAGGIVMYVLSPSSSGAKTAGTFRMGPRGALEASF